MFDFYTDCIHVLNVSIQVQRIRGQHPLDLPHITAVSCQQAIWLVSVSKFHSSFSHLNMELFFMA